MSLLIVGSCSRVTQNIVMRLAQLKTYQSITILDLLPVFYNLQKQIKRLNSPLQISLNKLIRVDELAANINSHQDLLYVTHDYFTTVTSKTKLMEMTAQLSKQKNAVFAAPLEYDHFGLSDPEASFKESQQEVFKANQNASFIRADIQDSTEFLAYIHHPKNIIEEQLFTIPQSFHPKILNSSTFNDAVIDALKGSNKGETVTLQGEQQDVLSTPYNKDIETHETKHHNCNACNLVKKYQGLASRAEKAI